MIVYLDKQFNKSIPREKRKVCSDKIQRLLDAVENGSEHEFLNTNNAKQMRGTEYIWKFRVTDSDRILYAHADHVPQLSDQSGAIVLLRYVDHDEQGKAAANLDLSAVEAQREYQTDFHFTEETTPEDTQKYFRKMLIHRIGPQQLPDYMNAADSVFDVVLSPEQTDILNTAKLPLILYGCAGSGKTILSAHILYQTMFCNPESRGLYTSLSQRLPEQVSSLFSNIDAAETGEDMRREQVDFLSVPHMMLGDKKPNRLVQYDDFRYAFCDTPGEISYRLHQLEADSVSSLDLWAEIRGILKGHLDENWRWNNPINRSRLTDSSIRYLEQHGFIEATDNHCQDYIKSPGYADKVLMGPVEASFAEEIKLSDKKKADILENVRRIDAHFSRFDPSRVSLSLSEYLSLSEEYSVYPEPVRQKIYEVFLLYQSWLEENQYFDENDLARQMAANPGPLYDFIAVDEVQDLTEMQIYALFRSCRDPGNMVFAGDIHQVVNPTYYSEDRIRTLYFTHHNRQQVTIEALKKNYRSQDKIVDLANDLSRIRKHRIGSRSLLSEQSEESIIEGWRPMQLTAQGENLGSMVRMINELPYAAAVVPDEDSAEVLSQYLEGDENRNIYTVPEIKGLEKRYIFCYNIVSRYQEAWTDIFSETDIRKNIKYRYYFNTLYVAVTRAQNYLCFYEDRVPASMQSWINTFTDSIPEFDAEKLFLTADENAGESWYESALRCEENGDYHRAIAQFKKSMHSDYLSCIQRCRIRQMLAQHRDQLALTSCLEWKAFSLLPLIAEQSAEESVAGTAARLRCLMDGSGFSGSVADLLDEIRPYDPQERLLPDLMNRMIESAFEKISSLTRNLDDLTKGMT